MPDQDRYQAVITKFVGQSPIQSDKARVLSNSLNFSAGIASSREIELIGLVDQLRDSFQIDGVNGPISAVISSEARNSP